LPLTLGGQRSRQPNSEREPFAPFPSLDPPHTEARSTPAMHLRFDGDGNAIPVQSEPVASNQQELDFNEDDFDETEWQLELDHLREQENDPELPDHERDMLQQEREQLETEFENTKKLLQQKRQQEIEQARTRQRQQEQQFRQQEIDIENERERCKQRLRDDQIEAENTLEDENTRNTSTWEEKKLMREIKGLRDMLAGISKTKHKATYAELEDEINYRNEQLQKIKDKQKKPTTRTAAAAEKKRKQQQQQEIEELDDTRSEYHNEWEAYDLSARQHRKTKK
jgi:DNA repair exonuclease SbcCD ATPase subunit